MLEQNKISETFSELPWLDMGGGFMLGLAVGYFLKKSFKIFLFTAGAGLVFLFILENQHIVILDEERLNEVATQSSQSFKHFALFLKERLNLFTLPSSSSAVVGFLLGLKIG